MNKLLLVAAAGLSIAAVSSPASAVDGTITFQGSVTAPTCTISGTKDFTVTLPTIATTSIGGAGTTAGAKAFNISLTGCAAGTVRAHFEPTANVDTATKNLKNVSGTATNVQVQLLSAALAPIDLTASNAPTVATTVGANTLTYYAQYYSTGTIVAGTVTTSVQYTLQYN